MDQNTCNIYVKTYNGKLFDLMDTGNMLPITDYSLLDKELVICENSRIELGNELKRTEVTSIEELKKAFEETIDAVIQTLNGITIDVPPDLRTSNHWLIYFYQAKLGYFDLNISDTEKEQLAEELVFDILFDKYLSESELMTRNGYSSYLSQILYTDPSQRIACARAINETLSRGMKSYSNRMQHPSLRKQLKFLGIPPDLFDKYYTPDMKENISSKKPKYIWDLLYYNFGRNLKSPESDDPNADPNRGMITSRQYRRQLTRNNRNYSYKEIADDLKQYDAFVNKLLPAEREEFVKYFRRSMDYYVLESYKRVDNIFKLIASLPQDEITKIDNDHFLVRRFCTRVFVPYEKDGKVCPGERYRYYRPLLMIEDALLKQIRNDDTMDYYKYDIKLRKYQLIRAKAYEIFKYRAQYTSTDYADIKKFLCNSYDMRQYHGTTDIWNTLAKTPWRNMETKAKEALKEQLKHFLSINEAFFWKLPN